jgi:hypothetical protein
MSDQTPASPDEEPPVPVKLVRSVTPPYRGRPDREMDVFGWGMFLGLLVLLVPFLPLIAVVWGVKKLLELLF